MEKKTIEEILKNNERLGPGQRRIFQDGLNDFQKDMAVIILTNMLTEDGRRPVEIYNLLAREEDQYVPKT